MGFERLDNRRIVDGAWGQLSSAITTATEVDVKEYLILCLFQNPLVAPDDRLLVDSDGPKGGFLPGLFEVLPELLFDDRCLRLELAQTVRLVIQ